MISDKVDQGKQLVNDKMEEVTFKVAAAADDAVECIVIKSINESDAVEPETVDFPGREAKASWEKDYLQPAIIQNERLYNLLPTADRTARMRLWRLAIL